MTDCDIIMPGTNQNAKTFQMNCRAIESLKDSCDARLLFLDNNCADFTWCKEFEILCKSLGYRYLYCFEPFNMGKFFNHGYRITKGKYICYSNSDLVFHKDWLKNILELWEENPEFYSMHSYSFHPHHKGLNYRNDDCAPIRQVIECDHPGSGLSVMRRTDRHVWDETFSYWENDHDYWRWMKANGKKAGICLNARVDHDIEGVMKLIDEKTFDERGLKASKEEASAALRKKWGLDV